MQICLIADCLCSMALRERRDQVYHVTAHGETNVSNAHLTGRCDLQPRAAMSPQVSQTSHGIEQLVMAVSPLQGNLPGSQQQLLRLGRVSPRGLRFLAPQHAGAPQLRNAARQAAFQGRSRHVANQWLLPGLQCSGVLQRKRLWSSAEAPRLRSYADLRSIQQL